MLSDWNTNVQVAGRLLARLMRGSGGGLRAIARKQWKMGRARFEEPRHRSVGRDRQPSPDNEARNPRVRAETVKEDFSLWPDLNRPNGFDLSHRNLLKRRSKISGLRPNDRN